VKDGPAVRSYGGLHFGQTHGSAPTRQRFCHHTTAIGSILDGLNVLFRFFVGGHGQPQGLPLHLVFSLISICGHGQPQGLPMDCGVVY